MITAREVTEYPIVVASRRAENVDVFSITLGSTTIASGRRHLLMPVDIVEWL